MQNQCLAHEKFLHSFDLSKTTDVIKRFFPSAEKFSLLGEGSHFQVFAFKESMLENLVMKVPRLETWDRFSAAACHRWLEGLLEIQKLEEAIVCPFELVTENISPFRFLLFMPRLQVDLSLRSQRPDLQQKINQGLSRLRQQGIIFNDIPQWGLWQEDPFIYDFSDFRKVSQRMILQIG